MRYVFDDYELDTQTCELRRAGQSIPLAPKAYVVLLYLVEHRDRLIPKKELLDQVWPDTYVDDSAVKRNILAVRRAIEERPHAPQRLKTQRGQGYRFTAAVTPYDHEPLSPVAAPLPTSEAAAPSALSVARPCAACQYDNGITACFCVRCGSALNPTCPQCGQEVARAAVFCPACGQRLTATSAPASASTTHPPTELPCAVRRQTVAERKHVTVLYCTLANAPGLVERVGLDAVHGVMQAIYELAHAEVELYAGTLQEVMGESFLVFFGAPLAQEDHALRAVRMALGLQRRLHESGNVPTLPTGESVALRMALHTGLVVVGAHRRGLHETAVVGDVIMLAAALARQAPPDTIVASAATLRLVQGQVETIALTPLRVAEYPTPLAWSQVVRAGPSQATRATTIGSSRSPFVGRDMELALLHRCLVRVQQGQGQVVAIIGELGIGKSRLLEVFYQRFAAHIGASWQGRCQSYGSAVPYLPLIDLLRTAWGVSEADDAATLSAKVHKGLQAIALELPSWVPYVLHLLGGDALPDELTGMPPDVLKARTFDALQQVLLSPCRHHPCVLAIEDLHWMDATSEAFLATLVERLAGIPLLLLVTFRPGVRPSWLAKSYATQIALPPLDPDDCRQIVRPLLGPGLLATELEPQLLAKAQGNPFFLEELAHTARELGATHAPLPVPDTVQAVLATRIDCLPTNAKRLLQMAAVIGPEVPVGLLHAIAELSEDTLHELLTSLQAGEFLYETQRLPGATYAFKHALIYEVAYSSLLYEQRRALHGRIVDTLEQHADDRSAEQIDRLAQHARDAEMWDKAYKYFWRAGVKAMANAANREAVTRFEAALHCLQRLPGDQDTRAPGIDIRLDMRNALLQLGENARCLAVLREAEPLAEDLDDALRLGWIASFLSTHCLLSGDSDQAIAAGERALALASACEQTALQADVHLHLGQAYHARGHYQKAIEVLAWNVKALADPAFRDQAGPAGLFSMHSVPWLVWCLGEIGAFPEGLAHGQEAIRLAETVGHPYGLVAAYGSVGLLYLRKGELDKAVPQLERSLALCRSADILLMLPTVASSLGAAYALGGRLAAALPLLEQAVAQATAMHLMLYHALTVASLSEAYLLAGDVAQAHEHAVRALALCQAHKEEGHHAWVLRLLGDIAVRREPPDAEEAAACYQVAQTRARALGMRPLLAHCHLGLSRLYCQQGQSTLAGHELVAAMELYRTLDMGFWQQQAAMALAHVGSP
jgi:DNA-binding winged helix-turn-helix (wHTH) protein/class 3 adenylate cyclase/tetratricopeptide (TPR) repeat protein